MVFEFFSWWYGQGWLKSWRMAGNWVSKVDKIFSIGVLATTLFSPWKQIISVPGRSIDEKFKAMIDNLVSRVIGFVVRFTVLLTAGVLVVVVGVAGLALAIAWPLIPLAAIFCFYRTIT